jgi:membrane glycosyltransferase
MITAQTAIRWRRIVFAMATSATFLAMLGLMAYTLSSGGLDIIDWLMLVAFAITLPWPVIGFWNALIGLGLMIFSRRPEVIASPIAALGQNNEPITERTAVLVCVRNEDPVRLRRNLENMLTGLATSGAAEKLHCFIISDSDKPEVVDAESLLAAELKRRFSERLPVTYRRRAANTGYKAGNIRDFCERWGSGFDNMVVLDADSFMSTYAILRLIRIMQADPKLGIVQSLVVGMPSTSPFARIFQFGMRLGMRSFTLGSTFWQADCGPYWGHNAIIRMKPFMEQCDMPLAGGKHILSHDQVEAALMRRAGYEVRVLPLEDGSWEENPPTLLEFMRRDLRWCEGNMQYWRLLALPGLHGLSRFQLAFAILMYIGSPAWMAFALLASTRHVLIHTPDPLFRPDTGPLLLILMLAMTFAPKLATVFDVLTHSALRRSFGGTIRFILNLLLDTLFTTILAPIMAVTHTVFIGGLCVGRTIGWTSQLRDEHAVSLGDAVSRLWLQTWIGAMGMSWFAKISAMTLLYSLPLVGSLALAVPFAMITALPGLGAVLSRFGVARIPEETAPPDALHGLKLTAIALSPTRTAVAGAVP